MRVLPALAVLAFASVALMGRTGYSPGLAIGYADSHWTWAVATGRPAPIASSHGIRLAARVPGPGWFQPDFQCAEFVGRSLASGGIPVPLVPESNPRWPVLVNVDRLSYYLLSRGLARWTSLSQLRPGDVILFRYQNPGHPPSPTVWSHMALVVHTHPVLLDAHNSAHYHIPLAILSRGTYQIQALHVLARPQPPKMPHFRPGSPVQIGWRDLWTTRGAHLYWGQVFPVQHQTHFGVNVAGVPGYLPPVALRPVSPTPKVGQKIVLGMSAQGQSLLSGRFSPIPPWTGSPRVQISPPKPPGWEPLPLEVVQVRHAGPLEPLPGQAALPKAWMPAGAYTVVNAEVMVGHTHWAQVEWGGARQGLGYVPWTSLKTRPRLSLQVLTKPLHLRAPNGARATVQPPAAVAQDGGRVWYRGALLSPY